ncbi:O-antigen ligase family protein [Candidatus Daviesbacteria bacterium]|nr:O-antigen ligase family protein [Candidatus Daviesbacteria bacterium]
MDIYSWILALAIISGQLIKLPIAGQGGATVLDLAIILFCLLGLVKLKFKLKKPPLFLKSAMVFIVIAILSLMLTPLHLRPEEILISFFYTVRFAFYTLLCWIMLSGAFPALKNDIQKILILSGLTLAVAGLIQFLFLPDLRFLTAWGWDPHYFRTVSTFLDPNFAGAYLVLTLLLLIYAKEHLIGYHLVRGRIFYIFFVILYVALLTTFSRSSYLMFLVSGTIWAVFQKSTKLFLITVILFSILLLGFQIYVQLVASPRNIDREQSASFRFNTWEQGAILFQKFPILGVGFNTYRYAIKQFNLGDEQFLKSHGASSNDSSLLFVASTTGVVGLTAYLIFLISLVKYSHPKNLVLGAAIGGLLIHSIFSNSLFYPPIFSWIMLISAVPKK